MTTENTLIILSPASNLDNLKSIIDNRKSVYTLFLPTKHTTSQEYEAIDQLRAQLNIPKDNHLAINISSIVQKTWRILNHYSHNPLPLIKGEMDGVEVTPSLLEKCQPNRQKLIRSITKINQERLNAIEKSVKEIILHDQATKLQAKIISP